MVIKQCKYFALVLLLQLSKNILRFNLHTRHVKRVVVFICDRKFRFFEYITRRDESNDLGKLLVKKNCQPVAIRILPSAFCKDFYLVDE